MLHGIFHQISTSAENLYSLLSWWKTKTPVNFIFISCKLWYFACHVFAFSRHDVVCQVILETCAKKERTSWHESIKRIFQMLRYAWQQKKKKLITANVSTPNIFKDAHLQPQHNKFTIRKTNFIHSYRYLWSSSAINAIYLLATLTWTIPGSRLAILAYLSSKPRPKLAWASMMPFTRLSEKSART